MFYDDQDIICVYLIFYGPDESTFTKKVISDIGTLYQGYFFETIFAHVELITYDTKDIRVSFSSTYEDGVRKVSKQFRRNGYKELRRLKLTKVEYGKCLHFLERAYAKELKYDYGAWARFNCLTDCLFPKKGESYFCSELVCKALLEANVLDDTWKPHTTTSQMLYEKFQYEDVPTKLELDFLGKFYVDMFDMV